MRIQIRAATEDELKEALIVEGEAKGLPSMHDSWRFNFATQLRKLSNAKAFVLITTEAPNIIEGCMIFQWREKVIAYMAYIETAPHNRGAEKKYYDVAGCLIAFAWRLSLASGDENHQGYLSFDVMEANPEHEKKLMHLYTNKYGAVRIGDTTLIITPENGEKLLELYLP